MLHKRFLFVVVGVIGLRVQASAENVPTAAGRYRMKPVANSRHTVNDKMIPRCGASADATMSATAATVDVVFDGISRVVVNDKLWTLESVEDDMVIASYAPESTASLELWFWRDGREAHGFLGVYEVDKDGHKVCGHGKQMRGSFKRRPLAR